MADFIYDKQKGNLKDHGESWNVRSGIPGKYSPTPNGTYTIPKDALMSGTAGQGVPHNSKYSKLPYSYKDAKGLSWFLWIGSGNLGIHPDGNVPGTKGCIGISDSDTKALFDKFKKLNIKALTLQVK